MWTCYWTCYAKTKTKVYTLAVNYLLETNTLYAQMKNRYTTRGIVGTTRYSYLLYFVEITPDFIVCPHVNWMYAMCLIVLIWNFWHYHRQKASARFIIYYNINYRNAWDLLQSPLPKEAKILSSRRLNISKYIILVSLTILRFFPIPFRIFCPYSTSV